MRVGNEEISCQKSNLGRFERERSLCRFGG